MLFVYVVVSSLFFPLPESSQNAAKKKAATPKWKKILRENKKLKKIWTGGKNVSKQPTTGE